MTRSIAKKLTVPLEEGCKPKEKSKRPRESHHGREQQKDFLAIAKKTFSDDEASSYQLMVSGESIEIGGEVADHAAEGDTQRSELAHKADECDQNNPVEQVCLSGGDIYDDPSLLRSYQNDDILPWGNSQRNKEGEVRPKWVVRSKFKDELSNFMLENKLRTKGIGEMLDQHRKGIHEQFSQILTTTGKGRTLKPEALTFVITTRSRTSTRDPPFPTSSQPTTTNHTVRTIEKEGPEGEEPNVKQKKDDDDERLLSIFRQIHINLSFLEAMIHMPKGAKRSLPQKEGDPGSLTLSCLIGPLAVKNALADLGASINLMPHSLFRRLGISKLKPTRISIQLADRSIKYPIEVYENLLVKVNKFIFLIDFGVSEMDEDELVPIILGRPFLATARVVIDVHEGKLSLRVRNKTVTFNNGKSMKSKYSRNDYLHCADHTTKLVRE
ncbi:putative reverse transcriptase domain-containing protein [Tanacetum coccineum]